MPIELNPTWKNVDELVKLKLVDEVTGLGLLSQSLIVLEGLFADDDIPKTKEVIKALCGEKSTYIAELHPLSKKGLTIETHRMKLKKYYDNNNLVDFIYNSSILMLEEEKKKALLEAEEPTLEEKPKKKKRRRARATSYGEEADVDVAEVDAGPVTTEKKKRKPSKKIEVMDLRDKIKFDKLQPNEALDSYVPSIDENYVYPQWVLEFVLMLDNGLNSWLYGGTGAGKSSLAEQVCAVGKLPLMYQSFHEDIKPDQLFGGKDLVDGNTVWVDGPVTKAYREGFVLLLDEIDGLPPEIQFCLYGILDGKPLILAENGNEIVKRHSNFRVIATGNTQGRGDDSGMFSGTNILNRAFLNRYRVWYKVDYPEEHVYRHIIESEGIDPEVAKVMARLAKEINAAFMNGTLTETFSLRDAREVAKVAELTGGDIGRALQLTLLDRLSPTEKQSVNEMFRRYVPNDL